MIDTSIIDAIKDLDIVEVARPYIMGKIERSGSNYKACCPFHSEKTPSFNLRPSRGTYKCFGCGKGGDAISFVMEKESLSFHEAVEYICDKHGIAYKPSEEKTDPLLLRRQRQLLVIQMANKFFLDSYAGSTAQQIATDRGFSLEISQQFLFGYAKEGFSNLIDYLKANGVTQEEIISCSLGKEGTSTTYDFFRNRLMFPIQDHMGKIIGFSGRALKQGQIPKYINTAETELYHKSKNLFGLHAAKTFISQERECIVVEGAPDVIAMHQVGFKNTVGTLGTALTADHAKIIKKYTTNVLLMYDGDTAGLKAVFRACEPIFSAGLFVSICRLPEGEDPDVFVKRLGYEEAVKYIQANKRDWIEFRTSLLSQNVSDRIVVARELKAMIEKHPDRDAREIMMHDYSKKFGLTYDKSRRAVSDRVKVDMNASPEYNLLRVCLNYGVKEVFEYYLEDNGSREWVLKGFVDADYRRIAEAIFKDNVTDIQRLLHSEDSALKASVEKVMNMGARVEEDEEWDMLYTFVRFEIYYIDIIEKELRRSESDDAKVTLSKYMEYKKGLKEQLSELLSEKQRNLIH